MISTVDNLALLQGNAVEVLRTLASGSVRCCVTSPPYWALRRYMDEGSEGAAAEHGLEQTPAEYVARLVEVFEEVKRVLADDGTLWLNLGDSYAGGGCGSRDPERWPKQSRSTGTVHLKKKSGLPAKNLVGIPWRTAFALQDAGWILRQDIIWEKSNPLPGPLEDRCVSSHEYLFLLSKSPRYYFDHKAIQEPSVGKNVKLNPSRGDGKNETRTDPNAVMVRGFNKRWRDKSSYSEVRNKRSVWTLAVAKFKGAHTAVMPERLVEPCILAGTAPGDVVLDPFYGSGTVGVVALRHGRCFVGIDLNEKNLAIAQERIDTAPALELGAA